jgi:hypothetical protein
MTFETICRSTALVALGMAVAGPATAQQGTEDLAKAAQNPIASMISLPFQNNSNLNFGPLEKTQNVLNVQPVYPFNLSEDWKVITRTIIPIVSQPALAPEQERTNGIGNTTFVPYFSPRKTGKALWGVAPVLVFPASDASVGSKAWGLGASAVLLTMPGNWVVGSTFTNVTSVNANPADKFNLFTWQYFINYNMSRGWYLTSAPIITANWEASSGNKWTVPFGGGVGRVFRIGKQAMNSNIGAFYNVERPQFGPNWQIRFQLNFLFPK